MNAPTDPRLARAAHLSVQPLGDGYRVTGGQAPHLVTLADGRPWCDCPDFAKRRGQPCKHVLAVELVRATDGQRARVAEVLGIC
jgi:hypothetical protein